MSRHAEPVRAGRETVDLLRDLLPRFYWLRDGETGGTLQALIEALAAEYEALRDDVAGMYDDLFAATCAPDIVPYIGEGIGVSGLGAVHGPGVGDRAWVGRVIGFRRRKGLLSTVARAASAATGWAVYAQEGGTVTAHTQSVLYPDTGRGRLVDVSRSPTHPDAPWSTAARGVSVLGAPIRAGLPAERQPAPAAGYPAPLSVRLAVWRLQSFRIDRRAPAAVGADGRAFAFHPAGVDSPLFADPRTTAEPERAPGRRELPLPLTVPDLERALRRAGPGSGAPVAVWRAGVTGSEPVALEAGDLADWRAPRTAAEAVVDPVRGRLLFTRGQPHGVRVSYAYGFSGALGGGPYGSAASYSAPGARVIRVTHKASAAGAADTVTSLDAALAAAARLPEHSDCLVLIDDSESYGTPAGHSVALEGMRTLRIASTPQAAPVLRGPLRVQVAAGCRFELSGVMLLGRLEAGGAGELAIDNATLSPQRDAEASVTVPPGSSPSISLSYAITGRVNAGERSRVHALATIVDGQGGAAIGSEGRPLNELDLRQVTVLGSTAARHVVAEDCIFADRLTAESGLVRASYAPNLSALGAGVVTAAAADARPLFTSTRWGDPAYGQLALRCPRAISAGASLGGEMGAFNWLRQPTRFERLPLVLEEMLPAGVAAIVDYRN